MTTFQTKLTQDQYSQYKHVISVLTCQEYFAKSYVNSIFTNPEYEWVITILKSKLETVEEMTKFYNDKHDELFYIHGSKADKMTIDMVTHRNEWSQFVTNYIAHASLEEVRDVLIPCFVFKTKSAVPVFNRIMNEAKRG
jgi:hypothetical protein